MNDDSKLPFSLGHSFISTRLLYYAVMVGPGIWDMVGVLDAH